MARPKESSLWDLLIVAEILHQGRLSIITICSKNIVF